MSVKLTSNKNIQDYSIWARLHKPDNDYRNTKFKAELVMAQIPLDSNKTLPIIYARRTRKLLSKDGNRFHLEASNL